ncbi:hypothetical protein KEJ25_00120 [Candidatus Bathyarchaeota archaeon]|nr:hypothetical protein [Candidatus Bathyarchaeota archaeon]
MPKSLENWVKREILKTLLRIKRSEEYSLTKLSEETKISVETIKDALMEITDAVTVKNDTISIAEHGRVQIAILCLNLAADPSYISRYLDWREFEDFTAAIVNMYGYMVYRNYRFKSMDRRWEIDILAIKKPVLLCLNCKHFLKQSWTSLRKAALEELERAEALKQALPGLKLQPEPSKGWRILPAIVTLLTPKFKIYDKIPVVKVTELRNFLEELTLYVDSLRFLQL